MRRHIIPAVLALAAMNEQFGQIVTERASALSGLEDLKSLCANKRDGR
jgi:hypothetical protein